MANSPNNNPENFDFNLNDLVPSYGEIAKAIPLAFATLLWEQRHELKNYLNRTFPSQAMIETQALNTEVHQKVDRYEAIGTSELATKLGLLKFLVEEKQLGHSHVYSVLHPYIAGLTLNEIEAYAQANRPTVVVTQPTMEIGDFLPSYKEMLLAVPGVAWEVIKTLPSAMPSMPSMPSVPKVNIPWPKPKLIPVQNPHTITLATPTVDPKAVQLEAQLDRILDVLVGGTANHTNVTPGLLLAGRALVATSLIEKGKSLDEVVTELTRIMTGDEALEAIAQAQQIFQQDYQNLNSVLESFRNTGITDQNELIERIKDALETERFSAWKKQTLLEALFGAEALEVTQEIPALKQGLGAKAKEILSAAWANAFEAGKNFFRSNKEKKRLEIEALIQTWTDEGKTRDQIKAKLISMLVEDENHPKAFVGALLQPLYGDAMLLELDTLYATRSQADLDARIQTAYDRSVEIITELADSIEDEEELFFALVNLLQSEGVTPEVLDAVVEMHYPGGTAPELKPHLLARGRVRQLFEDAPGVEKARVLILATKLLKDDGLSTDQIMEVMEAFVDNDGDRDAIQNLLDNPVELNEAVEAVQAEASTPEAPTPLVQEEDDAPSSWFETAFGKPGSLHRDIAKATAGYMAMQTAFLGARVGFNLTAALGGTAFDMACSVAKPIGYGPATMWRTAKNMAKATASKTWNVPEPAYDTPSGNIFHRTETRLGNLAKGSWYFARKLSRFVVTPVATPAAFLWGAAVDGPVRGILGADAYGEDSTIEEGRRTRGGLFGLWSDLEEGSENAKKGWVDAFQFGPFFGAFMARNDDKTRMEKALPDVFREKGIMSKLRTLKEEDFSHLALASKNAKFMTTYKQVKAEHPLWGFGKVVQETAKRTPSDKWIPFALAVKDFLNLEFNTMPLVGLSFLSIFTNPEEDEEEVPAAAPRAAAA